MLPNFLKFVVRKFCKFPQILYIRENDKFNDRLIDMLEYILLIPVIVLVVGLFIPDKYLPKPKPNQRRWRHKLMFRFNPTGPGKRLMRRKYCQK
ncbi:MAG: hypothetical protein DBY35_06375 [Bacteroidales bacterium]|nr:MAG: hypothetical protein DBY35_06375 [Bacteroidales bacterium]